MFTDVLSDEGHWSPVQPQKALSVDSNVDEKSELCDQRSNWQRSGKQLKYHLAQTMKKARHNSKMAFPLL